jgi:hypothetical protein
MGAKVKQERNETRQEVKLLTSLEETGREDLEIHSYKHSN